MRAAATSTCVAGAANAVSVSLGRPHPLVCAFSRSSSKWNSCSPSTSSSRIRSSCHVCASPSSSFLGSSSSSSSNSSRLSSSILPGSSTNSRRRGLSSSSSSSSPSSLEASAEKARQLFFEQLGFGNVVETRLKAEKEAIRVGREGRDGGEEGPREDLDGEGKGGDGAHALFSLLFLSHGLLFLLGTDPSTLSLPSFLLPHSVVSVPTGPGTSPSLASSPPLPSSLPPPPPPRPVRRTGACAGT